MSGYYFDEDLFRNNFNAKDPGAKEGIETEIEKNVIAKSGLNMNNGRLVKVNNLNNELCMAVVE